MCLASAATGPALTNVSVSVIDSPAPEVNRHPQQRQNRLPGGTSESQERHFIAEHPSMTERRHNEPADVARARYARSLHFRPGHPSVGAIAILTYKHCRPTLRAPQTGPGAPHRPIVRGQKSGLGGRWINRGLVMRTRNLRCWSSH
jgi:hypothetical protein